MEIKEIIMRCMKETKQIPFTYLLVVIIMVGTLICLHEQMHFMNTGHKSWYQE